MTELPALHQRRSYPKPLKAQIVAECARPGGSIAAIALSHGINANLLHKWIYLDRACLRASAPVFVPVGVPPAMMPTSRSIEIRLQRGEVQGKRPVSTVWIPSQT
ncbi:transposase [Microvirgula aerodenitrificans]|uniref:transposase n=1 Tax=Microvirgula aerodenitrificans TaxID=57480 RepID=UPI0028F07E26|nr:transposase [Microvirgula aerodenitrificans]